MRRVGLFVLLVVLARRLLIAGSGSAFTIPLPTDFTVIYNGKVGSDPQEIYIATSTDGGVSFTIGNGGNPIIPVGSGGSWNDAHVAHPSVLQEATGWTIYASGWDGAVWRTGRWTAATLSDDPADWTPDPSNPLISPTGSQTGTYVPACQADEVLELTRIWYLVVDGGTFSTFYAERDWGTGTITEYGEVLSPGGSGDWNEIGSDGNAPHTIGGQKRLFVGGQGASGNTSSGWASYTNPRVAATYTDEGQILAGPITVADGAYDDVAITAIVPYGPDYLVFGTLLHPTGFPANQREIAFRTTSSDGLTFGTPVGEVIPLSTAWPNVESAENPQVVVTP